MGIGSIGKCYGRRHPQGAPKTGEKKNKMIQNKNFKNIYFLSVPLLLLFRNII